MKHLVLIPLLIWIMSSCSKEHLSCNPDIEKWAQANVEYFSTASRQDLVSLPLNRLRAIYRGFSNEKKASLWLSKIDSYSKNLEGPEKDAYLELKSVIIGFYCSQMNNRKVDEIALEWENRMRSVFGWDDETIFFSSCTWLDYDEYVASSLLQYEVMRVIDEPHDETIDDCECIYNIGCPGPQSCEKKTPKGCNEVFDCGIGGHSPCKGICM